MTSKTWKQALNETIANMPELQNITDPNYFVGGGFSALGNASSFHNPFVREVRNHMYAMLKQKLQDYDYIRHCNIELLIDRMMFRPQGVDIPFETYHYDTTPDNNELVSAHKEDVIIGGWVNCNETESQQFICVPSEIVDDPGKGFTKLTKKQSEAYKKRERKVVIPPYHAIFFNQNLVHRIARNNTTFDIKRVFIGFRLSNDDNPLVHNIDSYLTSGSVVPLKSGQIPPMWPKLYKINWKTKLEALSNNFPDCMKDEKGTLYRFAKSLVDLKDPLGMDVKSYKYSVEEKCLYRPQPIQIN